MQHPLGRKIRMGQNGHLIGSASADMVQITEFATEQEERKLMKKESSKDTRKGCKKSTMGCVICKQLACAEFWETCDHKP